MRYKIEHYEIWIRTCEVEASSEGQALEKMEEGDILKNSEGFEYSERHAMRIEKLKEINKTFCALCGRQFRVGDVIWYPHDPDYGTVCDSCLGVTSRGYLYEERKFGE